MVPPEGVQEVGGGGLFIVHALYECGVLMAIEMDCLSVTIKYIPTSMGLSTPRRSSRTMSPTLSARLEPARRWRPVTARATRRESAPIPLMSRSLSSAKFSSWRERRKAMTKRDSARPPRRVVTRAASPTTHTHSRIYKVVCMYICVYTYVKLYIYI